MDARKKTTPTRTSAAASKVSQPKRGAPSKDAKFLPHLPRSINEQKELETKILKYGRLFAAKEQLHVAKAMATDISRLRQLSSDVVHNVYPPIRALISAADAKTYASGMSIFKHVLQLCDEKQKNILTAALTKDLREKIDKAPIAVMLYELSKEMKAPQPALTHALRTASEFLKSEEDGLLQAARLAAPDDRVFLTSLYTQLTNVYLDTKDIPKALRAADDAFAVSSECKDDKEVASKLSTCSTRLFDEKNFEHAEKLMHRAIQMAPNFSDHAGNYVSLIRILANQPAKKLAAIDAAEHVVLNVSRHFKHKHNRNYTMSPEFYRGMIDAAVDLLHDAKAALPAENLIKLAINSLSPQDAETKVNLDDGMLLLECYLAQEKTAIAEEVALKLWPTDYNARARLSTQFKQAAIRLQGKEEKQTKLAEKFALTAALMNPEIPRDANVYLNDLLRFFELGMEDKVPPMVLRKIFILSKEIEEKKEVLSRADTLLEGIKKVFVYAIAADVKDSKETTLPKELYELVLVMVDLTPDPIAIRIKLQTAIKLARLSIPHEPANSRADRVALLLESLDKTSEDKHFVDAKVGQELDEFVTQLSKIDDTSADCEKLKIHAMRLIQPRNPAQYVRQHLDLASYQLKQKEYPEADDTMTKACDLAKALSPPNEKLSVDLCKFADELNPTYVLELIEKLICEAIRLLGDTPANKKQQIILKLKLADVRLKQKAKMEAEAAEEEAKAAVEAKMKAEVGGLCKEAIELAKDVCDTELSDLFYKRAQELEEAKLEIGAACFVSAFEQGDENQKLCLLREVEDKGPWGFIIALLDKHPRNHLINYNRWLHTVSMLDISRAENLALLKYLLVLETLGFFEMTSQLEENKNISSVRKSIQSNLAKVATLSPPNGLDVFQGMPPVLLERVMLDSLLSNDESLMRVPPERLFDALQIQSENSRKRRAPADVATMSIHFYAAQHNPDLIASEYNRKVAGVLRAVILPRNKGNISLDKAARYLLHNEFKRLGKAHVQLMQSNIEEAVDQVFDKKAKLDDITKRMVDAVCPSVRKQEDQKHVAKMAATTSTQITSSFVIPLTDRQRSALQTELANSFARYCPPDRVWDEAFERQCTQELAQLLMTKREQALKEQDVKEPLRLYLRAHNPPDPRIKITFESTADSGQRRTLRLFESDFEEMIKRVFQPGERVVRSVR